jgi:hypothetical protein
MDPTRPLGQGWIDSVTDDVHEMSVVAGEDVERFVSDSGGELYVWLTHHGFRRCGVTIVEAETTHPGHDKHFRRVSGHGLRFDLYVEAGHRVWPRRLELETRGRKVRAYWNGLALVA